jgi:general secretion pathway protein A
MKKVLISVAMLLFVSVSFAKIPVNKAEKTAKMVAAMIVAGRGVVASNQNLINDPEKGDKGFTPEYVKSEMIKRFEMATGESIDKLDPDIKKVVNAVLEAAMRSVKVNQARINKKGRGFKGYIPAVFGRETGQIMQSLMRGDISIKQTTHKYRNAYNKPDEFESNVLKKFENAGKKVGGYGEVVGKKYRYLQPIYIKQACLKCHGGPKGTKDIAGKIKEGYKVGELRGAISVTLKLQ